MSQQGCARSDRFWLWDGETEYGGHLLWSDETRLMVRVRRIRRWTLATGTPGRPVPTDFLERQRLLTRRVCFGQSPGILMGALLELRVGTLQPSREGSFDYVLSGTYAGVGDEHLEMLSELSSDAAHHYLQSRRSGQAASC